MIDLVLRAEWVALSIGGAVLYLRMNGDPVWLVLLSFAADLSMLGYLVGPRLGAAVYHAVQNLVLALATLGIGWLAGTPAWRWSVPCWWRTSVWIGCWGTA